MKSVFLIQLSEQAGVPLRSMQKAMCCVFFTLLIALQFPTQVLADEKPVKGNQLCDREVDIILFVGNKTTRISVLRQELLIREGMLCDLGLISSGRIAIMDLGLFKRVKVQLQRNISNQLVLTYSVVEKFYILPIPRISRTPDGELKFGGQLRLDNFNGLNHQLKITSEKHSEDDGRGREGFEHKLDYIVPQFVGSRFGLSVAALLRSKQVELKRDAIEYGESNNDIKSLGFIIHRKHKKIDGGQGWKSHYGASVSEAEYELLSGEFGPFHDGRNVVLTVGAVNKGSHLGRYRRSGRTFGGSINFSSKVLGSDYNYQQFNIFYRGFRPVRRPSLDNINYQLRMGYSSGTPFGSRAYSVGGADSIRGLDSRTHDGDFLTVMNLEYLSAIRRYPSIRWVAFWDVGNAYLRRNFKAHLEHGVGLGLRWKVESLVRVDLRFDYAYGLGAEKSKVYFATSLNF